MRHRYSLIFVLIILFSTNNIIAQNISQNISYSRIYDFIDELATEGIIDINSSIKPYSRNFIAQKLKEAENKQHMLNRRQVNEIQFFKNDYSLELDTLPKAIVNWTNNTNFSLALVQPAFHYKQGITKIRITPILGMDLLMNKKGVIRDQRWGAELQIDIANHLSIWGSFKEMKTHGGWLNKNIGISSKYGALLYPSNTLAGKNQIFGVETDFIYNHMGYQYDLNNKYGGDFTDSRGGIKLYNSWGSIGLVKENIIWGDNYNGSNILSGRTPSFPMITLNLKPCNWFELNYIHGWLVSNTIDSSYYYSEELPDGTIKKSYRPQSKYIAANYLTFRPIPKLYISIGNSIIYAERNVQPSYFIPIAFYKALDKIMTRGKLIENQNSQIFFNISSRNINHLHLYLSAFVDEVSFKRFLPKSKDRNPISYKFGFKLTNLPLQNLSFTGEITRTNIITYKHSLDALTWQNNSIGLGHYLGDNAMDLFFAVDYKPISRLDIKISYNGRFKYNDYNYNRANILKIISQKAYKDKVFTDQILTFNALYEIMNNIYAHINFEYNRAKAYDMTQRAGIIDGENCLDAKSNMKRFSVPFFQGNNLTFTCGLNINF